MSSFFAVVFQPEKKCPNEATIIWVPGSSNEGRVKTDGLFNRNLHGRPSPRNPTLHDTWEWHDDE